MGIKGDIFVEKGGKDMPQGIPKDRARCRDLMPQRGGRNRLDHDKDLWYAVSEFAKGKTYTQIAKELSEKNHYTLSVTTVHEDIERCLIEWKRENMSNIDAYIAKELFRLDELELKARSEFEASKTFSPRDYAALFKMGYLEEDIDRLYKDKPIAGNPAFLQTIMDIQRRRMELLGIDKGNDVSQNTVVNYNFGGISDDELARLADGLQDAKAVEIMKEKGVDEQ